ncbi:hypothetical protein ACA29_04810, partial [Lederbergia galactosidilytica]
LISDAGWGMFRNMLAYKCERNEGILIKVEPKFTSQDCSRCGNRSSEKVPFDSYAYLHKMRNDT